jgi:TrmH family RNA methyltransferase
MEFTKIDSRDNPRLKLVRRVRDGKEREYVLVEGTRLVEEAVRSSQKVEFCVFKNGYQRDERQSELIGAIRDQTSETFAVNDRTFASISDTSTSQGIVLICRRPATDRSGFDQYISKREQGIPLVVMLSEVNNPSNLGAVIRTAEAAGAAGVIISAGSADIFSPKALRGSMGSAFRIPTWTGVSNKDALDWASTHGFIIVGASADANRSYTEIDWTSPHLLVMGSEAHGISGELFDGLDSTIRIPMAQPVESLNLAVAAGVVLFEARRQVDKALGR